MVAQVSATVRAGALPALPGAEEMLAGGIASSLAPANATAAAAAVRNAAAATRLARWPLLVDPQTGVSSQPPAKSLWIRCWEHSMA